MFKINAARFVRDLLFPLVTGFAFLFTPTSYADWKTSSSADEMTSKVAQHATSTSQNTVTFDFPYGGPQHGFLTLSKHPRYGNQVTLWLNKAHFLCRSQDCEVLVRFDGKEPSEYSVGTPADLSTDTVFIYDYDRFVSELVKAKQVKIEARFYSTGSRIFTFNVSHVPAIFSQEIIDAERLEARRRSEVQQPVDDITLEVARKAATPSSQPQPTQQLAAPSNAQRKMVNDWIARIQAKIKGRVVVPPNVEGNPEARFDIVLLPGGEVLSANLKKSSGNPAYDAAVERAIMAAQPLPVPNDTDMFQENFRELPLVFRPKD